MDRMVNYIQLAWKSACMLKTYRTCNSTVGFSKYKFIDKLLGGVILFRIISGVTWTQHTHTHTHTYIYMFISEKHIIIKSKAYEKEAFF